MNPPSMEVMFLLLSGVVLVSGVIYWMWSHIQLTQKKVGLLESAVFELRGMLQAPAQAPAAEPVPYAEVSDDWDQEQEQEQEKEKEVSVGPLAGPVASTPLEELAQAEETLPARTESESLEAMPVKELRRLAEQRGVTGVGEMRKKELLALLRSQVVKEVDLADVVDLE